MTMIEADAEMIMTGIALHTETETVADMMTAEVREFSHVKMAFEIILENFMVDFSFFWLSLSFLCSST